MSELSDEMKACTSPDELDSLIKKRGRKLSEADMMRITGGGDSREDVDPADAHADFVNGIIDGGELD